MAVIFLFIDGVGLGEKGPQNPFSKYRYPAFTKMSAGQPFLKGSDSIKENLHLFKGIDATLGVEGLPQSGTGQTTLFTGRNAAKVVGRHFGPFPHSKTKPLLIKQSIFKKAQQKGKSCVFMNAYPDIFFQQSEKRNRWSCTTLMAKSAGIPLHTVQDLKEERAVTAEITQELWRENLNIDVPKITPQQASQRVLKAAEQNDLVLYEYYLTDKAGHTQNPEKADSALSLFDNFLGEIIENRRGKDTMLLSSDHGNVEDLSTKTHTYNKVPLFVQGPGAENLAQVEGIQDVTPSLMEII